MGEVMDGRIELGTPDGEPKCYLENYQYVDGAVRVVDEHGKILFSVHHFEMRNFVEFLIDSFQTRQKSDVMKVFDGRK